MAYSETRCQELANKIKDFEDALDALSLEGGVTQISDGSQATSFTGPRAIDLKNRLDHYKRLYAKGSCPVILGNNDIDLTPSRAALKPVIGY